MDAISRQTAKLLIGINAISINPKKPFRYTSGILAPIYIDNRLVMSYPEVRKKIVNSYIKVIKEKVGLKNVELLSGTATAAIPQAAFISHKLNIPMVYVRDTKKGHGKENQVEGVVKRGQKVLVIEDHISTGGSTVGNVKAIRAAGGGCRYAITTTTYLMKNAEDSFKKLRIKVFTLTNFEDIIDVAIESNVVRAKDKEMVLAWAKNSKGWGKKMGFE